MKLLILFALIAAAGITARAVDLSKPVPVIRLADGRVLKNVTFSKFGGETVVMKSNLGAVVVRYDALPDDVRSAAEQKRPGGAKWFAGDTSGNSEKIEGQVFVQTQGAGAYKFGNCEVYAFDLSALSYFDATKQGKVYLPRPIHRTVTDGDGKFTLIVPVDRPFFVFVQASRLIDGGGFPLTQKFEWRIPMSDIRKGRLLLLSNDNRSSLSDVQVEQVL